MAIESSRRLLILFSLILALYSVNLHAIETSKKDVVLTEYMKLKIKNNSKTILKLQAKFRDIYNEWGKEVSKNIVTEKIIDQFQNQINEIRQKTRNLLIVIKSENKAIEDIIVTLKLEGDIERVKDNKTSYNTSETYLMRMKQIQYLYSDNKAGIVDATIILYGIDKIDSQLASMRFLLRNKILFFPHEPLYSPQTWQHAVSGFYNQTTILLNQIISLDTYFSETLAHPLTYIYLALILLFIFLYFRYVYNCVLKYLNTIVDKPSKNQFRLLFFAQVLTNGFAIALILVAGTQWFLNVIPITNTDFFDLHVTYLISSVAFYVLIRSIVTALFSENINLINHKLLETDIHKKLNILILVISILMFINGINFFKISTPSVLFYPPEITTIISFVISMLFAINIISIALSIYKFNLSNLSNRSNKISLQFFKRKSHLLLYVIALGYPLLIFLGFSNIANLVLVDMLQTICIVLAFIFIYLVLSNIFLMVFSKVAASHGLELNEDQSYLIYWTKFLIGLILISGSITTLLLIWGVQPDYIGSIFDKIVFEGFLVGDTAFSLSYISELSQVLIFSPMLPT